MRMSNTNTPLSCCVLQEWEGNSRQCPEFIWENDLNLKILSNEFCYKKTQNGIFKLPEFEFDKTCHQLEFKDCSSMQPLGVSWGQTAARSPIDWGGISHVATTSQSLRSHMDRYLPYIKLGGPDKFLRPPLSTIKHIALPIHHSDWWSRHPTMCLSLFTAWCPILRGSSVAVCPF